MLAHAYYLAVVQHDDLVGVLDGADTLCDDDIGGACGLALERLAQEFGLSTPYVSKYIKEKSGKTVGEQVTRIRMRRAKTLLRHGNMTVENISYSIGYPNAEHFIRTFKKEFGMTPSQFRNSNK